jgi:acyl-CoA dehydrogenase
VYEFTPEQDELRNHVRDFVNRKVDPAYLRQVEAEKRFPNELWDAMSEAGLHGVAIPEQHGGLGGGVMEQVIVVEELARVMAGLTTVWSINTHAAITLSLHGTEKQKAEILPRMAEGAYRIGLSITEPGGGTDVLGALQTKATKVDGGYVVNGSKMFTTMAEDVDQLILLARTHESQRKTGGLTVFLCPTDAEGVSFTRLATLGHEPIGTFAAYYDDVFIPDDLVIGEAGDGWPYLTSTLNHERVIIAALCTGSIQGVIDRTVDYAKQRTAFGKPIGQFQAVQHHIANMEISRQASRLLAYHAARLTADGQDCALEASIAKAYASEAISTAADLGIQILGGAGYVKDHDVERFWRDTRIMRIGPISNEMVRNYVAESLGLPRSF